MDEQDQGSDSDHIHRPADIEEEDGDGVVEEHLVEVGSADIEPDCSEFSVLWRSEKSHLFVPGNLIKAQTGGRVLSAKEERYVPDEEGPVEGGLDHVVPPDGRGHVVVGPVAPALGDIPQLGRVPEDDQTRIY